MQRFFRAADSLRPFVAEDLRRGRRRRSCDAGAGPVQGSPGARASPEDGAGDQGGAVGQFLGQKMGQVMGQDGQRMPKIYIYIQINPNGCFAQGIVPRPILPKWCFVPISDDMMTSSNSSCGEFRPCADSADSDERERKPSPPQNPQTVVGSGETQQMAVQVLAEDCTSQGSVSDVQNIYDILSLCFSHSI